jgi:hypothetical protein
METKLLVKQVGVELDTWHAGVSAAVEARYEVKWGHLREEPQKVGRGVK